jgi:hypothetical protein
MDDIESPPAIYGRGIWIFGLGCRGVRSARPEGWPELLPNRAADLHPRLNAADVLTDR